MTLLMKKANKNYSLEKLKNINFSKKQVKNSKVKKTC